MLKLKCNKLTKPQLSKMMFKMKPDQTMTTYLDQYNFEPLRNHMRVNDISQKWENCFVYVSL